MAFPRTMLFTFKYLFATFLTGCLIAPTTSQEIKLMFTDPKIAELKYHITMFTMQLSAPISSPVSFHLQAEEESVAFPLQKNVTFDVLDSTIPKVIFVYASAVGDTHIKVKYNSSEIKLEEHHSEIHVVVVHSLLLQSINSLIGWVYFFAWSISFYPQVYVNFKRKSVIGLNFDFLCYNITGFLAYSLFNGGLYYSTDIQNQYFKKYGGSIIPVQTNDVFFAFHAVLLTCVIIIQCCIYERGEQKVSRIAKGLLLVMWLFVAVSLIPALMGKITWLLYLNFFSYVKLAVTLIKYIPQALMNYRRKSTSGWSIGNVVLDFTGGSLSVVQMFFLSYNNEQWNSIFGDLTKFGLGMFSILFDILFMIQHYVLYRNASQYESTKTKDGEAANAFENPQFE